MHDKPAEKAKAQKTISCPLSGTRPIVMQKCPNKACMWRNTKKEGNCGYDEKADDTERAIALGMSLEEAALEIRRSKNAIQKIMVLDKYVDFVRTRIPKVDIATEIYEDTFLNHQVGLGLVWNEMFNMNLPLFVELCRRTNYKAFLKAHPGMTKFKLASILGVRESVLVKVVNRCKSLVRKKNTHSGSHKHKSHRGNKQ